MPKRQSDEAMIKSSAFRAVSRFAVLDACAVAVLLAVLALKLAVVEGVLLPASSQGEWWGLHSFSDYLSLMGGRRFAEEGFLAHYLTMNDTVGYPELARGWQYYQVPQLVQNSASYYTHYGSIDALIVGLLMKLGMQELKSFYYVFSVVSITAMGLWYASASILFGRAIGLISLFVYSTSVYFFSVAESPTAESLSMALTSLAVFGFVMADRVAKRRIWRWAGFAVFWAAGFLQANNSPQFIPFFGIFLAAYMWLFWPRTLATAAKYVALTSGVIVGFVVHFILAAWVLGGWSNLAADMLQAVERRTTGFKHGVEWGYREFELADAPAYLSRHMVENIGFSFIHLVVIAGLIFILMWRARGGSWGQHRLRDYWLVLAMLLGGAIFPAVFVQAAVTQPLDILKALLPGLSLLVAFMVVTTYRYLCFSADLALLKLSALLAATIVMGPYAAFTATGEMFSPRVLGGGVLTGQGDHYSGAPPDELRAVAEFVRDSTEFGDVVFAALNTGMTGHLNYPHPAWEYISERRVEVFDRPENWVSLLRDLEQRRQSLDDQKPARNIRFFALVDEAFLIPSLTSLIDDHGTLVAELDDAAEGDSPEDASPTHLRRNLALYLLDREAVQFEPDADQLAEATPDSRTPWTEVFDMNTYPPAQNQDMHMPIFVFRMPQMFTGIAIMKSLINDNAFMYLNAQKFDNSIGTTVEMRLKLARGAVKIPDGALLALQDGRHEIKVSFLDDHIAVFDQNALVSRMELPAKSEYFTIRLAAVRDTAFVYLDGRLVATYPLVAVVEQKAVLFGDYSSAPEEIHLTANVDYLAYSREGAFSPSGERLSPPAISQPDAATPWSDVLRVDQFPPNTAWTRRMLWRAGNFFTMRSDSAGGSASIWVDIPAFSDVVGATVEVRANFLKTGRSRRDSAMLALKNGRHEAKVTFLDDTLRLNDQNTLVDSLPAPETGGFVTYRLSVIGDMAYFYVDGALAAHYLLSSEVDGRRLLFGDFAPKPGDGVSVVVDYIAYSTQGAYTPQGVRLANNP